ncbi:MAG: terminase small subunit [Promethearchaeota archaeon]|jgi:phage terminase small subunit|tara:strand:+ start:100 stop:558 length:459 start_codon:yes stop_codon:yes gene_type:complete
MALNDQQERFCQSYILHRNASEAARAAGYSQEHAARQGHRLLQNEEVVERITELEQNLTTDVDVITEIEKQYEYARTNGHTNSAIKALELLSRIRGTQEEKEDMTDPVKLKEDLVKSAKIMGKDFYFDIAKEAGFLDRGNKVDNVDNKEHKE